MAIPGGQIATAEWVENYPGFPDGVSGPELGQLMEKQGKKYGLEVLYAQVQEVELEGKIKTVKTSNGEYTAKAIILAGGSQHAKLGVPGEQELLGKGVSYCAMCDGAFFRDKPIAVVGGGDAAITEALFLTRFATRVTLIHRRDQLRADKILQERAFANEKMNFIWDTVVEAITGEGKAEALSLRNVRTGEKSTLEVAGVFISVGLRPNTDYLREKLRLSDGGYVITNDRMETSLPGVFAAGDLRLNSARQAVTAAGDGATAALSAERYLSEQR